MNFLDGIYYVLRVDQKQRKKHLTKVTILNDFIKQIHKVDDVEAGQVIFLCQQICMIQIGNGMLQLIHPFVPGSY